MIHVLLATEHTDVRGATAKDRRQCNDGRATRVLCGRASTYHSFTMKYTAAAILLALGGADAYSVSRSTLRQLSQPKQVQAASSHHNVGNVMKMEGRQLQELSSLPCSKCCAWTML